MIVSEILQDASRVEPCPLESPQERGDPAATLEVAQQYRLALRRFASSVTIVTVRAGEEIHGMTATAVCSVSMAPPLLLVCVTTDSRTQRLIARAGIFAVNLLEEGEHEQADRFAGRRPLLADRFLGVRYGCAVTGAPILDHSLAYFDCRVVARHEGGDHTIFIGRVETAGGPGDGTPLVYHQGAYVRLPLTE